MPKDPKGGVYISNQLPLRNSVKADWEKHMMGNPVEQPAHRADNRCRKDQVPRPLVLVGEGNGSTG